MDTFSLKGLIQVVIAACGDRLAIVSPFVRSLPSPVQPMKQLQAKGIFASRDHRQWNRNPSRRTVELLGFKPCTEPGVINVRLILPEIGFQAASNVEMIELQIDV
ncbi:MAG TPA: hypothetical protein VMU48_01780 [Terracidiphilus sp.]|nr:hypothetical protein [Terracidiphilus sp.]